MRKARWAAVSGLAPVLLALAACGGSASDASNASAPTTSTPSTVATSAPNTTVAPTTAAPTPLPPTTPAPTTLAPLPVPAPVPNPDTVEPVIEVGRIEIPKIGVAMTMFEGVTDATLDLGPGHWPGTALPGQLGNVVVAGHRVSEHAVFRYVDQLVPGDEIVISNVFGGSATYVVTGTEVVDPTAVWIIDQQRAHTATLFACHPPGSTAERIVVHATLKEPA
jgi:sortase A